MRIAEGGERLNVVWKSKRLRDKQQLTVIWANTANTTHVFETGQLQKLKERQRRTEKNRTIPAHHQPNGKVQLRQPRSSPSDSRPRKDAGPEQSKNGEHNELNEFILRQVDRTLLRRKIQGILEQGSGLPLSLPRLLLGQRDRRRSREVLRLQRSPTLIFSSISSPSSSLILHLTVGWSR